MEAVAISGDVPGGGIVEHIWTAIYERFGSNHQLLYIVGTWMTVFLTFLLLNFAFGCLDVFGVPEILQQFKIQKTKNVPMSMAKYLEAAAVSTINMTVVVLFGLAMVWYGVASTRMEMLPSRLPTIWRALWDITLCIAINEISFYYVHRLLHASPFLFRHVHRLHHSWTAPCTMATFYAHPLEHLLANMGGLIVGPALVGMHLAVAWVYWAVGVASTIVAHSGYHLPLLPSSEAHDFHHSRGTDQYGTIGFLDWLHSSNRSFKNSINYKRHFTILWTPADVLIKNT